MAIGMTYEQYWFDDPLLVRAFYEADKIRQKRINDAAWLQGIYVLRALEATVGNLIKKKTDKAITYPEQPIDLEPNKVKNIVKTEEQEEQEKAFARAYMLQMVQAGKTWGKN